jgi:2-polyprenyl-3-methyl-5-hydroxy-6-metoxy-1,4-benzoquinol methylase
MSRDALQIEKNRIGTWGKINIPRLEMILKYAGQPLLDAGCSTGDYVKYLRKQGYQAFGLDLLTCPEWEEHSEYFKTGDLSRMPFHEEEFDTVTAFEVLEHTREPHQILQEIHRIVRRRIILSVPDAKLYPVFREAGLAFNHWVDRTHVHFFNQESLTAVLHQNGFKVKHLHRINPVYPERMLFEDIGINPGLAGRLTRLMHLVLPKRKFYMTLLAVADKERIK